MIDHTQDQYSICEAGAMTLIRTLPQFNREFQVSDDDSVLNRGADYFAIFQPEGFPNIRANGKQAHYSWLMTFDLYVRYSSRKESLPRFKAVRAALIKLFHPLSLNHIRGVEDTTLSASGGLQQDL